MNILTQYGQDIIGLDSELVNKIVDADTFIHTNKPSAQGGTDLTVVSTGDKYNWDHATGGTDVNVTQTASTANQDFEVLMSYTADNTTRTEGSRKSNKFKANPSTGNMTIGGRLTDVNGVQSIRRISEADYQALSSAEKNNGTIYHRYDKVGMDSLDINVKQTPNTISMDAHPILFSASDSSGEVVGGTYKNPDFYYRTDLNRLILNNEGSISVYHTSADLKYTDVHGDHIASYDINNTHSIIWIEANDITLVDVQDGGTTYHNAWGGIDNSLQTSIRTLKQSLSVLNDEITLSNNQKAYVTKYGRIYQLTYSNNQSASVSSITGQLPNGYIPGRVIGAKYANCDIYVNAAGAFEISANGWANLIITYIV